MPRIISSEGPAGSKQTKPPQHQHQHQHQQRRRSFAPPARRHTLCGSVVCTNSLTMVVQRTTRPRATSSLRTSIMNGCSMADMSPAGDSSGSPASPLRKSWNLTAEGKSCASQEHAVTVLYNSSLLLFCFRSEPQTQHCSFKTARESCWE